MPYSQIRSRRDYTHFLAADLEANGITRWQWWRRFQRPQVLYLRILRKCEFYSRRSGIGRLIYISSRLQLASLSQRLGISIPPGTFGAGLSLPHYGTIIVNDKAKFGNYCRIHCSTNVGESAGFAPQVGDFVYIGPGAVLYGNINIGDGAAIGANSVVGHDVPAGVTVAGSPAKVISSKGAKGVMPKYLASRMTGA